MARRELQFVGKSVRTFLSETRLDRVQLSLDKTFFTESLADLINLFLHNQLLAMPVGAFAGR